MIINISIAYIVKKKAKSEHVVYIRAKKMPVIKLRLMIRSRSLTIQVEQSVL